MNPFNAPDKVYEAMTRRPYAGPLFKAIDKLGPERIQWAGSNINNTRLTCWLLDGKKSSEADIYKVANIRYSEIHPSGGNSHGSFEY